MCSGGKGSISHGLGSHGTTTNTYLNNLEFNKKIKKTWALHRCIIIQNIPKRGRKRTIRAVRLKKGSNGEIRPIIQVS